MSELIQLLDMGTTAILAAAVVALWRDSREDKAYIRALLDAELNREDRDARAERQRRKMGRALGVDLDDTESRRPAGLDERLAGREGRD